MRSIYHIREFNVRRLSLASLAPTLFVTLSDLHGTPQLSSPHIFLSHDWPQSIEHHGDLAGLLRRKPFFRADINAGKLGSPPLMGLLRTLRPQWWFAAHMHVRFVAEVVHGGVSPEGSSHGENPDEIAIEDDEDEAPAATVPRSIEELTTPPLPRSETKFIALDKCVRGRDFLEVSTTSTSTTRHISP
jgi:lariat debranching enzyme